ncbi:hypothetical protein F0562_027793 [Nyssa sinensis]|uniref:Uncharacterized protein n=1 Tax=Nyssa sinensis TaxID=561372 RepID=A0A5J5B4K6_9ASTE|nr:hypothetical protein F0562_027793 [Nyssa sinensis]
MSSSNSATKPPNHPSIISVPTVATIKLSQDNYLLWKAQMVPYFRGQDLFGYLDGTTSKPPQTISVSYPETNVISDRLNLAYSQWVKQDNVILSTLMSSLIEGVLAQVYVSRHVIFDENLFPHTSENKLHSPAPQTSNSVLLPLPINPSSSTSFRDLTPNLIPTSIESAPLCSISSRAGHGTSTQPATNPLDSNAAPHENEQPAPTNTHSMTTRSKNHIHKPRQQPDGCIRYPLPRALIAETTSQALEPTSYTKASKLAH